MACVAKATTGNT